MADTPAPSLCPLLQGLLDAAREIRESRARHSEKGAPRRRRARRDPDARDRPIRADQAQ